MANSANASACSIVIRAYNEEKHIGRLLTGILQQRYPNPEIILVDSGSTDATVAIARRYPVKVIHIEPAQFTFGRALNLGISQTSGEFIVIASAHVYPVYPDWLQRLITPFSDPRIALTYGKQRGNDETRFSEHQIFSRWYPENSQIPQNHPFCNNANAALRRSLWEKHHYDETLSGLEDLAWSRWALEQNYQIGYIAEAEVVHVHNESRSQVYNRFRREAMAFKRIFPGERFHLWDALRLYGINIVSDLWHASRQRALAGNMRDILLFRWMQFWGTYKGYRHTGQLNGKLRQTFYYPNRLRQSSQAQPRGVEPIHYGDG